MAKHFQVDSGGTLLTNLISYYKLDDVNDYYASNNLTNNNTVTFVTGKIDNAGDFEVDSTQYLSNTGNLGIDGGAISFSAWIKLESQTAARFIVNQFSDTSHIGYWIHYNGSILEFERLKRGVADDRIQYSTSPSNGTWYHVVLTYDGSNLRGYLNGSEVTGSPVASTGNGSVSDTTGFRIGADRGNANTFDGLIDEVGVWSKALSTTEITDLYNSGDGQTMTAGTTFTRTLADTITLSESIAKTINHTISRVVSDTISLIESILHAGRFIYDSKPSTSSFTNESKPATSSFTNDLKPSESVYTNDSK